MSEKKEILGISAFYHDSAVCYIRDGIVVACLQEERFSRKKHDPLFPEKAISVLASLMIPRICTFAWFQQTNS